MYVCTYHTSGMVFLHNKILSCWVKDCWRLALYVFLTTSYISLSLSSKGVKNMSKLLTFFSPKYIIQSNMINNIKYSKLYFMLGMHENRALLDAYILGTITDKSMKALRIAKYRGKLEITKITGHMEWVLCCWPNGLNLLVDNPKQTLWASSPNSRYLESTCFHAMLSWGLFNTPNLLFSSLCQDIDLDKVGHSLHMWYKWNIEDFQQNQTITCHEHANIIMPILIDYFDPISPSMPILTFYFKTYSRKYIPF